MKVIFWREGIHFREFRREANIFSVIYEKISILNNRNDVLLLWGEVQILPRKEIKLPGW